MISEIFCVIFCGTKGPDDEAAIPAAHSPACKNKVALAAIRGNRTLAELVKQIDVHPNQIQDLKKQLITKAEHLFGAGIADAASYEQGLQNPPLRLGS